VVKVCVKSCCDLRVRGPRSKVVHRIQHVLLRGNGRVASWSCDLVGFRNKSVVSAAVGHGGGNKGVGVCSECVGHCTRCRRVYSGCAGIVHPCCRCVGPTVVGFPLWCVPPFCFSVVSPLLTLLCCPLRPLVGLSLFALVMQPLDLHVWWVLTRSVVAVHIPFVHVCAAVGLVWAFLGLGVAWLLLGLGGWVCCVMS
jgi:hypothetical protein